MIAERILLRPHKMIDSTQAWFWTRAWRKREREASKDIRSGRVRRYTTGKDFVRSLSE